MHASDKKGVVKGNLKGLGRQTLKLTRTFFISLLLILL